MRDSWRVRRAANGDAALSILGEGGGGRIDVLAYSDGNPALVLFDKDSKVLWKAP